MGRIKCIGVIDGQLNLFVCITAKEGVRGFTPKFIFEKLYAIFVNFVMTDIYSVSFIYLYLFIFAHQITVLYINTDRILY